MVSWFSSAVSSLASMCLSLVAESALAGYWKPCVCLKAVLEEADPSGGCAPQQALPLARHQPHAAKPRAGRCPRSDALVVLRSLEVCCTVLILEEHVFSAAAGSALHRGRCREQRCLAGQARGVHRWVLGQRQWVCNQLRESLRCEPLAKPG